MNGITISKDIHEDNMHIVDKLANIRAKIKELKKYEAACVSEITEQMGDADNLGGNHFIARQIVSSRKGIIDTNLMEKDGINIDNYRRAETVVYSIRLEALARDEV